MQIGIVRVNDASYLHLEAQAFFFFEKERKLDLHSLPVDQLNHVSIQRNADSLLHHCIRAFLEIKLVLSETLMGPSADI